MVRCRFMTHGSCSQRSKKAFTLSVVECSFRVSQDRIERLGLLLRIPADVYLMGKTQGN